MTIHATKRAAQRNLSGADFDHALRHGTKCHKSGACFYFLTGRDILPENRKEVRIARLEDTILILDPDRDAIVTIYRNRENGLKAIQHKRDYIGQDMLSPEPGGPRHHQPIPRKPA